MSAIVHVEGVPGSGKTFLCSMLRIRARCVDTDDLWADADRIADDRKRAGQRAPNKRALVDRMIRDLVRDRDKDRPLVFVGMHAPPRATHKFFIRLDDHPAAYRRLLLRELDKYVTRADDVRRHVRETGDPKDIDIPRVANLASIPSNYADFVRNYKARRNFMVSRGYRVMPQDDIARFIDTLGGE